MVSRLDLLGDRLMKLYAQVDNIGVRLNGHQPIPTDSLKNENEPLAAGLVWVLDAKLDAIANAVLMLESAAKRAETAIG